MKTAIETATEYLNAAHKGKPGLQPVLAALPNAFKALQTRADAQGKALTYTKENKMDKVLDNAVKTAESMTVPRALERMLEVGLIPALGLEAKATYTRPTKRDLSEHLTGPIRSPEQYGSQEKSGPSQRINQTPPNSLNR